MDEGIADTITAKAVKFIETNKDGPFFLYLATDLTAKDPDHVKAMSARLGLMRSQGFSHPDSPPEK